MSGAYIVYKQQQDMYIYVGALRTTGPKTSFCQTSLSIETSVMTVGSRKKPLVIGVPPPVRKVAPSALAAAKKSLILLNCRTKSID